MDVKKNWSTFWHRLRDRIRLHKDRLKRTRSMGPIPDFIERSNRSPEQQRPKSAGRRMNVEDNVSTERLSIRDRIRLLKDRLKRTRSMGPIPDFIERSNRRPEQQRPESAGRRRKRSTDSHGSNDKCDTPQERLKTSSMIIIHDFKESSSPSPEQQRPESVDSRMAGRRTRSTGNLRSNDIWDTPQERLKTSSMIIIHDFKESSSPSPEQQRPESAGRRMDVEDNVSTDWLTVPAFRSRQQSFTNYINFKKSSSLREKDKRSLETS